MSRNILLVEPNYKNKYPPMGLMKISSYYKKLGDNVTFFKGNLLDLVLDDTYEMLKEQLYANDDTVFWEKHKPEICMYLRKGSVKTLDEICAYSDNPIIIGLFKYYRKFFYKKLYFQPEFRKYDIVIVTTLFTFYWDITIETINFVKNLCKTEAGVKVGGVMATILPDKVEEATGIRPHVGTLGKAGMLGDDNDIIVDNLPLDYSILEEIDYKYPADNAYYAYMTRGCINKCPFCAVPKLEPEYKDFLPLADQVKAAEEKYGAKKDLLLLDNNVLASARFDEIIEEIKKAGFAKGDTYIEPNHYEIAVRNLRAGHNDKAYIKACVNQFRLLLRKYKGEAKQKLYNLLQDKFLLEDYTASKKCILDTYEELKPYFEELYKNKPKVRYVDFNQGIDSRLINNANMSKLAEIPIRPVRIAFDHWNLHEIYEKAVRTAAAHGHKNLSNYILYNFMDKPVELYWRLKLNVELCEELGASIYSFPMKYHPIEDPNYFSNRDYIGKHWCRKFIRAIQAILNSTKGKVGKGKSFFEEAFGSNEDEFYKLLYMPEAMIIYRFHFKGNGLTDEWWKKFQKLSEEQLSILKPIVEKNDFSSIESLDIKDKDILDVLQYYRISRNNID